MCDHPNREAAMVTIDRDIHGKPTVWCDPCIAGLVGALNAFGLPTVASCCGHGQRPGRISLRDGRELFLVPDYEAATALEQLTAPVVTEMALADRVSALADECRDDGAIVAISDWNRGYRRAHIEMEIRLRALLPIPTPEAVGTEAAACSRQVVTTSVMEPWRAIEGPCGNPLPCWRHPSSAPVDETSEGERTKCLGQYANVFGSCVDCQQPMAAGAGGTLLHLPPGAVVVAAGDLVYEQCRTCGSHDHDTSAHPRADSGTDGGEES